MAASQRASPGGRTKSKPSGLVKMALEGNKAQKYGTAVYKDSFKSRFSHSNPWHSNPRLNSRMNRSSVKARLFEHSGLIPNVLSNTANTLQVPMPNAPGNSDDATLKLSVE